MKGTWRALIALALTAGFGPVAVAQQPQSPPDQPPPDPPIEAPPGAEQPPEAEEEPTPQQQPAADETADNLGEVPPPPPGYGPPTQPPPQGPAPQQPYPGPEQPYAPYPVTTTPPPPERPPPSPNLLNFDPISLAIGILNIEYEHAFSESVSFYINPFLLAIIPISTETGEPFQGFGAFAGLRFFLSGHAPRGFWVGPLFGALYLNVEDDEGYGVVAAFTIGHSWVWRSFAMSLGGGFAFIGGAVDGGDFEAFPGPFPILRFTLGFPL